MNELENPGEPWPPSRESITHINELVAYRTAKLETLANKPMVDPRLLASERTTSNNEDVILSGPPALSMMSPSLEICNLVKC